MRFLICSIVILVLSCVETSVIAQEKKKDAEGTTIQLPIFAETTINTTVSVPDGGVVLMAGRRIKTTPRTSRSILASQKIENRVCSKQKKDNATVYDIIHDAKPLGMTVHDDGRIEMNITRVFTADDIDLLNKYHPDVLMHVTAFPTTSNGDSPVRLNLEIDSTYNFESEDELKESDPDLHKIFIKYVRPPGFRSVVTPRVIIQEEEEALGVDR